MTGGVAIRRGLESCSCAKGSAPCDVGPPAERHRLLGVEVSALTLDGLTAHVADAVTRRRRVFVGNHNLHSIYLYHRCPPMRRLYARACRTIIDGMPLVMVGRWLGLPLRRQHRLATLDWIDPLMAAAAARGWRVFVLAGRPGVAERGAEVLRGRHRGLRIETASGYFDVAPGSDDSAAVVRRINAARPHLLLVGMGMPRQERWLADHFDQLEANAVFNVGAVMDYIAGEIPTPPRWTGQLGIEWLFRLCTTPVRTARRYLVEPWSLAPLLLRDLAARRLGAAETADTPGVVRLLGVAVNPLTMEELTGLVTTAVRLGERRIIANHNLHSVYLYHRHARMRAMYAVASHTFIEGMSLVAAGRLLGLPLRRANRIAVLDWIDPLLARAAAERWRVFILAGAPGVARRAADRLRARHPGLLVETASGYFDTHRDGSDNAWMLERINRFRPNLLLVGMGMPRQEEWIGENRTRISANVILNVGGLMDCVAGVIPTAPRWLGPYGLEWLFRLLVTPRRTAPRYLLEPWTLLPVLGRELVARFRVRLAAPRRSEGGP
jgi:N-acetylglucosaminyldiphosphoundecaprenol N-acetyl-beta-D-mannosaminyltransferase